MKVELTIPDPKSQVEQRRIDRVMKIVEAALKESRTVGYHGTKGLEIESANGEITEVRELHRDRWR